jgi:hypothetical protein
MIEVNIQEYKRVIEDFIYLKKGIRIQLIFDDAMNMRRHFQMLCMAYDYIQQNKHK